MKIQLKESFHSRGGNKVKNEIVQLIEHFGEGLSQYEYNQYIPKLRDYFIDYLIENKSHAQDIPNLFKFEFTRSDIVLSTEYYVTKNESVRSKSAIDDFLIALNRFFDEVINIKYPNQNLITIRPFTNLSKDIEKTLLEKGIKLEARQGYPPIKEDQYKFIIEYLKKDRNISIKNEQVHIIIKLLLLYGFSFDRIMNLRAGAYCSERRVLEVTYRENPFRGLVLELPYSLNKEIENYTRKLNDKNNAENYLFCTKNGNKIKHDFPNEYLSKIKHEFFSGNDIEKNLRNPFTPTGLAKFAVINMIIKGINQSVILDLTGFKDDMYLACQKEVNEIKVLHRNRYINHMIRDISTYDEV